MNHSEVVQYLISIGVDLDTQATKGLTAMHVACERDYTNIAVLLLGAGEYQSIIHGTSMLFFSN